MLENINSEDDKDPTGFSENFLNLLLFHFLNILHANTLAFVDIKISRGLSHNNSKTLQYLNFFSNIMFFIYQCHKL